MNREELVEFLNDLLRDQKCASHTYYEYEAVRGIWKNIFIRVTKKHREGRRDIDSEEELEDDLLNLHCAVWEQREKHISLAMKIRGKLRELENEVPPQYNNGDTEA